MQALNLTFTLKNHGITRFHGFFFPLCFQLSDFSVVTAVLPIYVPINPRLSGIAFYRKNWYTVSNYLRYAHKFVAGSCYDIVEGRNFHETHYNHDSCAVSDLRAFHCLQSRDSRQYHAIHRCPGIQRSHSPAARGNVPGKAGTGLHPPARGKAQRPACGSITLKNPAVSGRIF